MRVVVLWKFITRLSGLASLLGYGVYAG